MLLKTSKLLILGFLILTYSCKIFQVQQELREELVIYPSPPDTARIQYLTTINSSDDIKEKRSPFVDFILGKEQALEINHPGDIISRYGTLFVSNGALRGFAEIDLIEKDLIFMTPRGKGEIRSSMSCAFDSSGHLFVADKIRKEVLVFNKTDTGLEYIKAFGKGSDFKPEFVFAFDNKLWVVSKKDQNVHVFDGKTFKPLFTFPNAERGNDAFLHTPKYVNGFGDYIYVTDFFGFNIKVYDLKGNFVRAVGAPGKSPGQFSRPKDIAIDREENLYALDAAFGNVQIFNNKGQLLLYFGGQNDNKGDIVLPKGIDIDYENLEFFEKYVDPDYSLKYLIYVTMQYGPNKVNVYGRVEPKQVLRAE
jgi:6-bladed beta-propeller